MYPVPDLIGVELNALELLNLHTDEPARMKAVRLVQP